MILVTGFGPFEQVRDNPSGALARSVHGARVLGSTLVGLELPVTYGPGLERAVAFAGACDCAAVIGLGVAVSRDRVEVERYAHNRARPSPDMDGVIPTSIDPSGPDRIAATADVDALASALGAGISLDAGGYVCNAWLYRMVRALPGIPVAFVHLPPRGLTARAFTEGLGRWLASI